MGLDTADADGTLAAFDLTSTVVLDSDGVVGPFTSVHQLNVPPSQLTVLANVDALQV